MVYPNLSEQLLLERITDGDAEAFKEIYNRYKKFVFHVVSSRLANAEEARDVTQDIFLNLWTGREQLGGIIEFKPYLFVFCRNQVISAYRRNNVRIRGEEYLTEGLNQIEHSIEDQHFAVELNANINMAIAQLPETMRNCYHLSKNEGRRNGEIAGILNISEKTVRNNVSEALKRVKLMLQGSHPELMLLLIGQSMVSAVFWLCKK
jgi:RNA polymerase sigma-70 factor (ECF subfamily)